MALKKTQPSILRLGLHLTVAALFLAASPLVAQEALRTAVQGDRSYEKRNASDYLPRDERMQIGPVSFGVSAYYGLEWNDNVNLTATNPDNDLIHRPGVNLRALWPATKDSTLSFGMGIGYEKYMDNSDLDSLNISPDSELAWDIPIKDWVITLYEGVTYSQDAISEAGLSGTGEFPRLENTIGVRTRWHPNRYIFEAGYAHYNFISDSSEYDYLTRSAEQFFGRVAYQVAAITRAGVEASAELTDYDSADRDDNQNVSVGPFVEWQLMRDLRIMLRGGFVTYSFDSGATTNRSSDLDTYYFGLSMNHQLTEHLMHGLSVVRSVQQGINEGSDVTEVLTVRYNVSWAFHRHASLSVSPYFEHGNEPQYGVEEIYDRFGVNLGVSYRLTDQLTTGLGYSYNNKDSDFALQNRDYKQNSVTLSVSYQF